MADKKKWIIASIAIICIICISCTDNSSTKKEEQSFVSEFRPDLLISETLGKFLSGESSENLEFTENYTADTSETRASDVTGIISVTASFSGYEYQAKYQISGNLDYTLPVEDGVIQGYRVENSEESLKVSSDGFTEPKESSYWSKLLCRCFLPIY